jgi:hypothetical protein
MFLMKKSQLGVDVQLVAALRQFQRACCEDTASSGLRYHDVFPLLLYCSDFICDSLNLFSCLSSTFRRRTCKSQLVQERWVLQLFGGGSIQLPAFSFSPILMSSCLIPSALHILNSFTDLKTFHFSCLYSHPFSWFIKRRIQ